MHRIFLNVFKEEISGYKGTERPAVESPHYDPGDVSGECPGSLSFLPEPSMLGCCQISSLLESSHICGLEFIW